MKNWWISNKNSFATWEITFRKPKSKIQIENILAFKSEMLHLGAENKVLHLKGTTFPDTATSIEEYMQQIEKVIKQDNILHFFKGLSNQYARIVSNLFYYNQDGLIINSEVSDMSKLMQLLHGAHITGRNVAYNAAPISISGTSIALSESNTQNVFAWISLFTNIWFPKVRDILADNIEITVLDNSELARLHTPHLNRFLATAKELTLRHDGEWHLIDGEKSPIYTSLLMDTGIQLS